MKSVKVIRWVFALLFVLMLLTGALVLRDPSLHRQVKNQLKKGYPTKETIAQIETAVNERYVNNFNLNIFGAWQALLGKREIRNFEVITDVDGSMYFGNSSPVVRYEKPPIASTMAIKEMADSMGIEMLFVQTAFKDSANAIDLNGYDLSARPEEADGMLAALREKGVNVLDLREYPQVQEAFRTDHHWTPRSSFHASALIAGELLGDDLPEVIASPENYTELTYPNSMLGSLGIKAGDIYSGRDDFTLLIPTFPTSLHYEHYIDHKLDGAYSGDFTAAFVDLDLLDNPIYNNKYNACLHGGYAENCIVNHLAETDQKAMLIADSFGRPTAMYLSLYFQELRYLDPRDGRYSDSFLAYIEEFRPDVIIIMYNLTIPL